MPFTANKGYGVPTVGSDSGTWGSGAADSLNDSVMAFLDLDLGGVNSTALTNVNVTWTASQGRNLIQRLTGTLTGNVVITTPNVGFNYIENATTGSFTVTLQFTGAVGGTVVCPQGYKIPVIIDSTNGVREASSVIAGVLTRYGLFDAISIKGSDIVAASTINLETATGNLVDVTGDTGITAITLSEGHERTVRFTGVPQLTHGASLVLPGAANITAAAGDYATFRGYSGGIVRCTEYQRAAAAPWPGLLNVPSPARAYTEYTTNENRNTVIPIDDTVPQITEGDSILSTSITLNRSNSRVRITVECFGAAISAQGDDAVDWTIALFRDSVADALKAVRVGQGLANVTSGTSVNANGSLVYEEAPGSVGPFTYSVRVGPGTTGETLRLNGTTSGQLYGGAAKAVLVIEEIFV